MSTGKRGNWRDAYLDRERDRSRDGRGHRDDRDRYARDYDRPHDDRRDWRHGDKRRRDDAEEGESASPIRPSMRESTRRAETTSPRRDFRSPRADFERYREPERHRSFSRDRDRDHGHREPERRAPSPKKVRLAEPRPEPEPELLAEDEEENPEKKLAEKRRRREAIMAKFRAGEVAKPPLSAVTSAAGSPNSATQPLPSGIESVTSNGINSQSGKSASLRPVKLTTGATPLLKALGTRSVTGAPISVSAPGVSGAATPLGSEPSLPSTPLGKDFDLEKHGEKHGAEAGEGVSAAEYDDARDKAERGARVDPANKPPPAEDEWEEVEIEVDDEDDDMDMFAAFGDEEPVKKKRKIKVRRRKDGTTIQAPAVQAALEVVDNVDDTEGYYRITPGEILDDGRYQVTVTLGKGMFSAVVKAKVLKAVGGERPADVVGREVAIKLMRSQESMYVAGRKEAQILKLLNDADPEDKKHIVRMERTFEHKGHLAIVTESLSMNLRDVIKRFGKDVGLNMRAVRAYAHQMLLALSLMRKCSIVHADIKPDNVLVSENKAVLKVCDLGTAAEVSDGEITPYLVSRFYRAPEIILGLPYDTAIDIWAIGCTLFELYTGKILFPGRSNNHMLLLQQETKGKLPHRMIKKAQLGAMHFDENNNFLSAETDRITGADVVKTVVISKATRDLRSRLMPSSSVQAKMGVDELKQLQQFVDLLDKCLMLDPVRRISPREALLHPFVTGQHAHA
ncbi:uncharacterized protein CcaverHIS019_0704030 [Cutaneotrichosporon cavernicola]|uniref:non-specific serine/threonine protein kinase n=1 Tax=Cutaneotrichosporon cavernicola TaxID=279322 RepID=A0AA48LAB3_9TREE|nr:uncharacterized protein CcaverHIS019_0704030 [Cutaneotrichosporon cavernicola]BEI94822.1 hypothetical protein CcaverHIS019_0704030 [Cutaneotrichosporon cavernicola]